MLEGLIPNRSSLRGSSTAGRSNQRSQRGARRRGAKRRLRAQGGLKPSDDWFYWPTGFTGLDVTRGSLPAWSACAEDAGGRGEPSAWGVVLVCGKRRSAAPCWLTLPPSAGFGGVSPVLQDISPKVKPLQLPQPQQRRLRPPRPSYRLSPGLRQVLAGAAPLVPTRCRGRGFVRAPDGSCRCRDGCSSGGAQTCWATHTFYWPPHKSHKNAGGPGGGWVSAPLPGTGDAPGCLAGALGCRSPPPTSVWQK